MAVDWTQFKVKEEAPLPQQVMHAFKQAGFSDEGSRVLAAEVGREGGFQPENVFGVHEDPANKKLNIGFISWQGERAEALRGFLKEKGLIAGNSIKRGQDALNAQANFLRDEMASGAHGGGEKLVEMLKQKTVDYQQAAKAIGKGYIKWRYDDPEFASGHRNRDRYFKQLGGQVGKANIDWSQFKPVNQGSTDWSKFKVIEK